ncbi:MAG: methyltransferase domain-containing protein [Deltaproteobacteria bacterium]|nr:methyltransferase domain-containing protein [Deltaproteobacteria bacterium]
MKPDFYGPEHAEKFKHRSMAESYQYRPPYSEEVLTTLLELLADKPRIVLDVGCGTGKIARNLVENVDRVDAIDFSEDMIDVGRTLPNGKHPGIHWIRGPAETVKLSPPYGLTVAGASLHWLDWSVVFPRFKESMVPDGYICIVDGDTPLDPPWRKAEIEIIRKYSTNQKFDPSYDFVRELVDYGLFKPVGAKKTEPVMFKQSIDDYIASFHSRESLCREAMGKTRANNFDNELRKILLPYSKRSQITFKVSTGMRWGLP